MLQPLITLLSPFVSGFTLQVSGTEECTQVILTPRLAAPAGDYNKRGYNENDHRFRALLTSPLVIQAPIGEIDTALASAIHEYSQGFEVAVTSPSVTTLLQQATVAAQSAATKSQTTKKVNKEALVPNEDDDVEADGLDGVAGGQQADAILVSQNKAAPSSEESKGHLDGISPDLLASLGL